MVVLLLVFMCVFVCVCFCLCGFVDVEGHLKRCGQIFAEFSIFCYMCVFVCVCLFLFVFTVTRKHIFIEFLTSIDLMDLFLNNLIYSIPTRPMYNGSHGGRILNPHVCSSILTYSSQITAKLREEGENFGVNHIQSRKTEWKCSVV